jgi:hypothetical protein
MPPDENRSFDGIEGEEIRKNVWQKVEVRKTVKVWKGWQKLIKEILKAMEELRKLMKGWQKVIEGWQKPASNGRMAESN